MCAGQDSNLRRHKSSDLQSDAIDHSATDALTIIIYNFTLFATISTKLAFWSFCAIFHKLWHGIKIN